MLVVFLAMFVTQAIGSAYNIYYNVVHISPLLTEDQAAVFQRSIRFYNLYAYPVFVALWAWAVFSLSGGKIEHQRRVIHLPWRAAGIAALGWLCCLPVLRYQLFASADEVNPYVKFHLPVSILAATAISVSLGYLVIDCLRTRLLFPLFFDRSLSPAKMAGSYDLHLAGRGVLWMISASLCPIVALLLLLAPPAEITGHFGFPATVAAFGVFFALFGMLLLRSLIAKPVRELQIAAQAIGQGRLDTSVSNLRADEFGILADEFNTMVAGLREKEEIRSRFGMHVGEKIANELLKNEAELAGVERVVSVLFSDVRGFTTICEKLEPTRAVQFLNLYHEAMTAVIDEHGGIVNQLVGDGFMSIFGATGKDQQFADHAVRAGQAMLRTLKLLNEKLDALGFDSVRIGVGIHTGPVVVGTIGSPGRMEYTAIGDTVNTAARIEGMTKELGHPLLISEASWEQLENKSQFEKLPAQAVRGRKSEIVLYADTSTPS